MEDSRGLGAETSVQETVPGSLWGAVLRGTWPNYLKLRGVTWCGGLSIAIPLFSMVGTRQPDLWILAGVLGWVWFCLTLIPILAIRRLYPEAGLGCLAALKGWILALILLFLAGAIDAQMEGDSNVASLTSLSLAFLAWLWQFYLAVSLVEGSGLRAGLARSARLLSGYHFQSLAIYFTMSMAATLGGGIVFTILFALLSAAISPATQFLHGSYFAFWFVILYYCEATALVLAIHLALFRELRIRQALA